MKLKCILLLSCLLLSSCATVFKGSTQPVTFNSVPEGAEVIIDGNLMGRTPMTVNLKKNKHKNALIRLEGYETGTIALTTSYDPIALLNVFWDLSTTDLVTGNAWQYEPGLYTIRLEKKRDGSSEM
jgi:hypothetical protein